MPELESRRFAGTVANGSGEVLGEARMWGEGVRGEDGSWSGWLRVADLGGPLPPGRYHITAAEGWGGEFEPRPGPTSRVFESELLPVTGIGPPPWPAGDGEAVDAARRPPAVGTPWQGAQGIPPYKRQQDYPRSMPPRPQPDD